MFTTHLDRFSPYHLPLALALLMWGIAPTAHAQLKLSSGGNVLVGNIDETIQGGGGGSILEKMTVVCDDELECEDRVLHVNSPIGVDVIGIYSRTSGSSGVYGEGDSYGVHGFSDGDGSGLGGTGVYGDGGEIGVWGFSSGDILSGGIGVRGEGGDYGVVGYSDGVSSNGNDGLNIGVYGQASTGVKGDGDEIGVYGVSAYTGVYGEGDEHGLYGQYFHPGIQFRGAPDPILQGNGYGVVGNSLGDGEAEIVGVYGEAIGGTVSAGGNFVSKGGLNKSIGVAAIAESSGEDAIGIFANATGGSPINYAGYFQGNVHITGNVTASSFNPTSDQQLKQNIVDVSTSESLDIVNQLQPRQYTFKPEYTSILNLPTGDQIGFVAQELEVLLPQLIEEQTHILSSDPLSDPGSQTETFKHVNYTGLIPILTAAIQQQQEVITSLIQTMVSNGLTVPQDLLDQL